MCKADSSSGQRHVHAVHVQAAEQALVTSLPAIESSQAHQIWTKKDTSIKLEEMKRLQAVQ